MCATSHCHGNHELRHDILLGVITASEASTLLGVDTDMDVYVYHSNTVKSTNAEQIRELLNYTLPVKI